MPLGLHNLITDRRLMDNVFSLLVGKANVLVVLEGYVCIQSA